MHTVDYLANAQLCQAQAAIQAINAFTSRTSSAGLSAVSCCSEAHSRPHKHEAAEYASQGKTWQTVSSRRLLLRTVKVWGAHLHEHAYLVAAGQVVQDNEGQDVQRHGRKLPQALYDGWDLVGIRLHLHASSTLGIS